MATTVAAEREQRAGACSGGIRISPGVLARVTSESDPR
jgi:hypothetical protein